MKFVYILFNNEVIIEIQEDRDKLSPFIRNKKQISNLEQKLQRDSDRQVLQFIKLLNQTQPPFKIEKEYLSFEIERAIQNSNFIFYKQNTKASLKRINDLYLLNKCENQQKFKQISPIKLKIIINSFLKEKVKVSFYLEFDETQNNIPLNYNLQIPILENKQLCNIDQEQKQKLLDIFNRITNKDVLTARYIKLDELNKLNENEFINIQYKQENKTHKNIGFISDTLFKMNIFNKNDLSSDDLDFYYTVLENYLQNKNYVEYNNKIILLDNENIIQDIDNETLLKVFSHNLDSDIKLFIDKLINIKYLVDKKELENKFQIDGRLNAKLKDYQEDGVCWLYNLYKNDLDGGLLADEMGLGKTIQVIAFLLLSKTKTNLIIAPASLVHNWKNEILKFTNIKEQEISLDMSKANNFITILSYEYARSKIDLIQKQHYDMLVMDESQKIKNHKTQIFNAITKIPRTFTVIMTGTPIENSLNDLWNMLFAINPSLHVLYASKIRPLLSDREDYLKAIELTINILHPIMLQRKKEKVLNLPSRDTKTLLIAFTQKEKEKYTQLVNTFTSALKSGLSGRIQSIALEGLLRLRQYCSIHSILPSSLLITNNLIDSKVNKTIEIIKKSIVLNEKIIIFSQFTSSLNKLASILEKSSYNYLRIDGSTTKTNRNRYVEQFQSKSSKYDIFLISLKAGGVGINLTSARTAILFEPWWNPAVEEQAFARIDRIGQKQTTKIYRLIYKDSIEEKMNNLVQQKQGIFDNMTSFLSNSKSLEMEVARDIFKIS